MYIHKYLCLEQLGKNVMLLVKLAVFCTTYTNSGTLETWKARFGTCPRGMYVHTYLHV